VTARDTWGTRILGLLVCVATLTGCATTSAGGSNDSTPTSTPTSDETATDAAADPFPDPDLSASNTCGQVTAYVGVISNAFTERSAGTLDDGEYQARLEGATEPLSNVDSDDEDISAALEQLSTLARSAGAMDPTASNYDAARQTISDACAAAGSPIVISGTSVAGG
jgi:hypothetical protein